MPAVASIDKSPALEAVGVAERDDLGIAAVVGIEVDAAAADFDVAGANVEARIGSMSRSDE